MMHAHILATHSLFRWLFLAALIPTLVMAAANRSASELPGPLRTLRTVTVSLAHLQLLLGLALFFVSPLVQDFLAGLPATMKSRPFRWAGVEHPVSMILSVVLFTIGSVKSKKSSTPGKVLFGWFLAATLIVLASIPWPFMGEIARPLFRGF